MRFVRRSVSVAPMMALVAIIGLGACGSDDTSATPSVPATTVAASTTSGVPVGATSPATDGGIVTSSIATPGEATSTTTAADAGATTTVAASGSGVVTSSVVTGSTTAPTTTAAGAATTTADPSSGSATTVAGPTTTTPAAASTVPDDTTPRATGNPTAFCAFEADIEDATNTDDEQVFLTALRSFEPKMTQWEADAPNVQLQLAAQKLHAVTKEAIAANSSAAFDGDTLNDAFVPISEFCGSLDAPAST